MLKNKIFKICLWILLVIFVIFVIYWISFQKIGKRRRSLEIQLDMLNKEIQYMKKENKDLKEGIFDSSKDEYLEKEARMSLGYKKEGETAVILSGTTTTKNQNEEARPNGLWNKILEWWKKL